MKKIKYTVALVLFLIALIAAGTSDYNEAKETEQYWKQQTN